MSENKIQRIVAGVVIAAISVSMFLASAQAQGEDEGDQPKHSIKDVMQAHKGPESILAKIKSGKATDAEKKELVDLYISLYENDPPMGDASSWKQKSGSALMASIKVMVGRDGAVEELTKATTCAACHKVHKPK